MLQSAYHFRNSDSRLFKAALFINRLSMAQKVNPDFNLITKQKNITS